MALVAAEQNERDDAMQLLLETAGNETRGWFAYSPGGRERFSCEAIHCGEEAPINVANSGGHITGLTPTVTHPLPPSFSLETLFDSASSTGYLFPLNLAFHSSEVG